MKILMLSEYSESSSDKASHRVRLLTSLGMSQKGHEVVFVCPSGHFRLFPAFESREGLKVVETPAIFPGRFRTGGFGFLDMIGKSICALTGGYDVIHATNVHRPAHLLPCILGRFLRTSIIVDERWEWLGRGGYADNRNGFVGKLVGLYDVVLELRTLWLANITIVISQALKDRYKEGGDVFVLNGGAESGKFVPYSIQVARMKIGIDEGAFVIGMSNVSRGDHSDNAMFFEAAKRLADTGKFYILMTGQEDTYIEWVKTYYGLADTIISPGYVDFERYNLYLSCCNVFVLPFPLTARNIGRWPNKLGDYLCLDRPVVTNDTGDLGPLFRNFRLGILCDATPEGFLDAVLSVMGQGFGKNDNLYDSIQVASTVLDIDHRIDKIIDIYEAYCRQ